MKWIVRLATHAGALAIGFALGVYFLPILTEPEGPGADAIAAAQADARFTGAFTRDLEGSDLLHWGEGSISVTPDRIVHEGRLSPGPDYKIYLTTEFVETEEAFFAIQDQAVRVGSVDTFDGFIAELPEDVDPADYSVVVIWCEAFSEFITAARYQ